MRIDEVAGGYAIAANVWINEGGKHHQIVCLILTDKKEQWHKTFGQPRGYDAKYIHDESYGVNQTPDGGYVICGGTGDEYD